MKDGNAVSKKTPAQSPLAEKETVDKTVLRRRTNGIERQPCGGGYRIVRKKARGSY